MTAIGFLDLPVRDQQAIVDHVRASAALMTNALSSLRILTDTEMEDVCRWVIDGYLSSARVTNAYAVGFDAGHEAGYSQAMADDPRTAAG